MLECMLAVLLLSSDASLSPTASNVYTHRSPVVCMIDLTPTKLTLLSFPRPCPTMRSVAVDSSGELRSPSGSGPSCLARPPIPPSRHVLIWSPLVVRLDCLCHLLCF